MDDERFRQIQERLRQRLEQLGKSATQISRDAGLGKDAIRDILRGKSTSPALATLDAIARAMGWTLDHLLGRAASEVYLNPVHVIGAVQAGTWRGAVEWIQSDWYQIAVPLNPRFARFNQYGLEVRGDSMNELYPHGSVVICVRLIDLGTDPRHGDKVVCLRRGPDELFEATIKELRLHDDGSYWLWPRSTNPAFQQPWRLTSGADGDFDNEDVQLQSLVIGSYRAEA